MMHPRKESHVLLFLGGNKPRLDPMARRNLFDSQRAKNPTKPKFRLRVVSLTSSYIRANWQI